MLSSSHAMTRLFKGTFTLSLVCWDYDNSVKSHATNTMFSDGVTGTTLQFTIWNFKAFLSMLFRVVSSTSLTAEIDYMIRNLV